MILLYAGLIDEVLEFAGVWATCSAVGGTVGVTAAVLLGKSVETMELWGFTGTAVGSVSGVLAMAVAAILG